MCVESEVVEGYYLILSIRIPKGIFHPGWTFEVRKGLCLSSSLGTLSFFSERGPEEVCVWGLWEDVKMEG